MRQICHDGNTGHVLSSLRARLTFACIDSTSTASIVTQIANFIDRIMREEKLLTSRWRKKQFVGFLVLKKIVLFLGQQRSREGYCQL